jgi:hypothetical protein
MARLSLDLFCGALIAVAAASGCDEYGARIYSAHPYRAGRNCLQRSIAIGVVQAGQLAATCPGQCLLLDETLYVSSVCPPVPVRARPVTAEESPACAAALALLASEAWCERPDAGAESADAAPADGSARAAFR